MTQTPEEKAIKRYPAKMYSEHFRSIWVEGYNARQSEVDQLKAEINGREGAMKASIKHREELKAELEQKELELDKYHSSISELLDENSRLKAELDKANAEIQALYDEQAGENL